MSYLKRAITASQRLSGLIQTVTEFYSQRLLQNFTELHRVTECKRVSHYHKLFQAVRSCHTYLQKVTGGHRHSRLSEAITDCLIPSHNFTDCVQFYQSVTDFKGLSRFQWALIVSQRLVHAVTGCHRMAILSTFGPETMNEEHCSKRVITHSCSAPSGAPALLPDVFHPHLALLTPDS